MGDGDTGFTGAIPDIYDDFMVPLIFEPYARDLAERTAALAPQAVLETAAGSGVLTRALAARLGPSAHYVATDLNQPMLDRAAARQGRGHRIAFRQADAMELPFADGAFDAVICQFGAMFFPDRPAAFAEARRVLAPGGCFLFNTWDRLEENHFPHVVVEALAPHFPENPAEFMRRIPHGYHAVDRIEADLRAGGFGRIEVETLGVEARAACARDVAVAFVQGTPTRNGLEAVGADLAEVTAIAEAALVARFGEGPVAAPIRAHVVTARV